MNRYYSRKDKSVGVIYAGIVLACWTMPLIPFFHLEKDPDAYVVLITIAGIITLFVLDVWTYTYYEIKAGKLYWHTGHLFSGSISIESIRYISTEKSILTVNGIYKPTLSFHNITVGYNKYDELLIAPKDEAGFIKRLLDANPSIASSLEKPILSSRER